MKIDLFKIIKDNNYEIEESNSNGLNICNYDNEITIKGDKTDLIDLANYIVNIALSDNDSDHIHLDELTIIDNNSEIKNLIIEKTSK